ncbi:MAG: response regulator [Bdellovibrionales bacterium]|nr:response regulator [Bdellovibrionales bacterium]
MFNFDTPILIVDDMLTMRKLVAKALRGIGFTNITDAKNGNEAWEKLTSAEIPFGLVISDWMMPDLTGIDFLKRVRLDPRTRATPFLLLTAESSKDNVAEAVTAGVSSYIVKPFTPDTLKKQLQAAYAKHQGKTAA